MYVTGMLEEIYIFFAKPIFTQIFRIGSSCYIHRINKNVNIPFIKLILEFLSLKCNIIVFEFILRY